MTVKKPESSVDDGTRLLRAETTELDMDRIHPWICFDWIGLGQQNEHMSYSECCHAVHSRSSW